MSQIVTDIMLDMDSTTVDFWKSHMFKSKERGLNPPEMYEPGFFETLPPMPGALSGVRAVLEFGRVNNINIHILSKPVSATFYSYSEKAAWISKWFPELVRNIILCQHKELVSAPGRVLIDDHLPWKDLWEGRGGTFILFDEHRSSAEYWLEIVEQMRMAITPINK